MPYKDEKERKKYHRDYYEKNKRKLLEKSKAWREINGDEIKEKNKKRYWANRDADLARSREYREKHREKIKKYNREYYLINSDCIKVSAYKWRTLNPKRYKQIHNYRTIVRRCENPKAKDYHRYGGRGIKCDLTLEDYLYLWERCGADKMKVPTIDRINNDGNYTIKNCRIIEMSENVKKSHIDRAEKNNEPYKRKP
jgi:hypothetical protein